MKRFVLFLLAATTLLCVGCKKENNKTNLNSYKYTYICINITNYCIFLIDNIFLLNFIF